MLALTTPPDIADPGTRRRRMLPDTIDSRALYLRLVKHVRPYWRTFAVSLAATMVLAATEPAMPAIMKPLLDGSFIAKDPTLIWSMPLLLLGIFLVRGAASRK